jgi:peptidoglycan/xylan/chitin deacetylase (PgdA/CDA1 family)
VESTRSPPPLSKLAVLHGPREGNSIALTFDDGPAGGTVDVLRILDQYGAKGTFFVVGKKIPGNEALLRRIVREGHELGNHSFHHLMLPARDDVGAASALIRGIVGSPPRMYRPPFGAIDVATSRAASELGMRSVRWDVDSEDVFPLWEGIPPETIYANVVDFAQAGSIVLMHDGCVWSKVIDALPAIVETLTERGFRLVTVTELLDAKHRRRRVGKGSPPAQAAASGRRGRWLSRVRAGNRRTGAGEASAFGGGIAEEELAAMKPRHVVDLLERHREQIARGALTGRSARMFSDRVVENPAAFAELSGRLVGLGPSVVVASLKGLEAAAAKWRGVRWDGALTLVESTLSGAAPGQPSRGDHSIEPRASEIDRHLGRRAAVGLLEAGMRQSVIPRELAGRVWPALEALSWEFEPTVDRASAGETAPEAVRARAVHAIVEYGAWRREASDGQPDSGMAPEAARSLEEHLDPALEGSAAVRAVYGQRAALLLTLDRAWLADRLEVIFPSGGERSSHRLAAWNGYLVWGTPTGELFELLEDRYRQAIRELPETENRDGSGHGASRNGLARHLDIMYRIGAIDLADDGLLQTFADRAAPRELEYFVGAVGLFLHRDDAGEDPALCDRLMRLWEAIHRWTCDRQREARRTILARFGLWYAAGVLDQDWCDHHLALLLREGVPVDPEFRVVERLGKRTHDDPRRGVELTGLYVNLVEDPWRLFSVREGLQSVFEAARSADGDVRLRAQEVERVAAAKGFPDFTELLAER